MNTLHLIQTAAELIGVAVLVVALLNERKIADFEKRFFQRLKTRFSK